MKARQNLSKRMVAAARRSRYDVMASSYGDEWERLLERRGLPMPQRKTADGLVKILGANAAYGKTAGALRAQPKA